MKKAAAKQQAAGRTIEVMDTTLRDGEQTYGVAFSAEEKFTIARTLIERLNVDRIEIASARVSDGEGEAVRRITQWAKKNGFLGRVEILGFCDVDRSADWIGDRGGKVINLLTKGSHKHLTEQLRKTPEEHLRDIRKTVEYCTKHGISCNCYPEDWSGGMLETHEYGRWFIEQLAQIGFKRIMLPDTLGRLFPEQVRAFVGEMTAKYPAVHFDFHPHNDYGLATANSLTAVHAGVQGVHVTVNGLGERAGNASLDEVVVGINDILGLRTRVNEEELITASKMVEVFSGRRVAANKPISGVSVFTQTAGIHADGDKKGNLYITKLSPERFKRTRTYALGKHSGKASLDMNLKDLGIELTPEQKKLVLEKIVELGDRKKTVTLADLPFVIADVINVPMHKEVEIVDCVITTTTRLSPCAAIKVTYKGKEYQANAVGNGGYDAFMKALRSILTSVGIALPKLIDYEVRIPPGGRTDALVETTITWEGNFITRGVNSDQVKAAIAATENMLNLVLVKKAQEK